MSAVASLNGATILVALSDGGILTVDSASGVRVEHTLDPTVTTVGAVTCFEVLAPDVAYALKGEQLVRLDGHRWTALPAQQGRVAFTAEHDTGRLFAATDADVFSSADGGHSWVDASMGLPARPHCTDMRVGREADGCATLYLTTYGRSVWRATITQHDQGGIVELPPHQRALLLDLVDDGAAIVRLGEQLLRVTATQPATDLLAGLVVDQIAQRTCAGAVTVAAVRALGSDHAVAGVAPHLDGAHGANGQCVVLAGLIATAVGCETVIGRPLGGSLAVGFLLGGGPLLYVATQTWFLHITSHRPLKRRWIGCAALAAAIPAAVALPVLATLGAVTATLIALAAYAPRRRYTTADNTLTSMPRRVIMFERPKSRAWRPRDLYGGRAELVGSP